MTLRPGDGRQRLIPEGLKPHSWKRAVKADWVTLNEQFGDGCRPPLRCSTTGCMSYGVFHLIAKHTHRNKASRNFCAPCAARLHAELRPDG